MNVISTHEWGDKKLICVKVLGKWRKASRFVGNMRVEYTVDLDNMQLMASYGNVFTASLSKYIGFKVQDYAYYSTSPDAPPCTGRTIKGQT